MRLAALGAGVSSQEWVGRVLREAAALTEGEPKGRSDDLGSRGAEGFTVSTRTAASPSVSVPAGVDPATGEVRGRVYARAGCSERVPEGVRCAACGAVHKP